MTHHPPIRRPPGARERTGLLAASGTRIWSGDRQPAAPSPPTMRQREVAGAVSARTAAARGGRAGKGAVALRISATRRRTINITVLKDTSGWADEQGHRLPRPGRTMPPGPHGHKAWHSGPQTAALGAGAAWLRCRAPAIPQAAGPAMQGRAVVAVAGQPRPRSPVPGRGPIAGGPATLVRDAWTCSARDAAAAGRA